MPLASGFFVAFFSARRQGGAMPQRAKLLYTLQRIDSRLVKKKRRYLQVGESLGESSALRSARQALREAKERQAHWRSTLVDRELEAKGAADKLVTDEKRLYSGRVTNPRELGDLQKEVEYLKRRRADLEDKQLEAMMSAERASAQVAVVQKEFEVIESAWKSENSELSEEYDALRAEIAQLFAQRKAVVKHVSAEDLAEYNTLRRLLKGTAVVAVKNGVCRVCNVQVPQRDWEKAQQTDQLYYCSGCERILYVPEST
jgi:predicted  nucleic acid-binding Zn-ribbon protein